MRSRHWSVTSSFQGSISTLPRSEANNSLVRVFSSAVDNAAFGSITSVTGEGGSNVMLPFGRRI